MLRQINFLIIFVFCLTLVLFSLENTEIATIKVVKDIQVQAPLSVELLLAMGVGAVLAWIFSVWARLQQLVNRKEVIQRDARIQELEQNIEQYKAEAQLSLPAAKDTVA